MLTLKKVKELVGAPSHAKRTPSPKMLYEEGIVLLRREFDQGSHLTVYNSGYVLFSAGKRNTVFHIHDCCGDYAYDAAEGKGDVIEEEYFENCEWHIRALFEGERKMEDNQAKCEGAGRSNVCVSYHALSEDWSEIADRTINMLEKIIENFLPLDRSGNRRFIPVMVYPEQAEVHILEDEAASRAYIEQMWAEAMEIYRSGRFKLAFSPAMQRYLKEHQRDFMPEDTKAGMIQAYLDKYTGSMVCSKQLYKEALNHAFDEPKQWEIREINEIMNQCIDRWRYFPNPRMFSEYGRQKGWERENPATDSGNPSEKTMDGFVEVTEQMELPF